MTREICSDCGRESCCGFSVSDDMWRSVVDGSPVLCLSCWDDRATARGVSWDTQVTLWPVDGLTLAGES